jgi:hypothetical protein
MLTHSLEYEELGPRWVNIRPGHQGRPDLATCAAKEVNMQLHFCALTGILTVTKVLGLLMECPTEATPAKKMPSFAQGIWNRFIIR